MRIFYAFNTNLSSEFTIKSIMARNNLYSSLIEYGIKVVEFEYQLDESVSTDGLTDIDNQIFIEQQRVNVSTELLRQIRNVHRKNPIDIFLSSNYENYIFPDAVEKIKDMGIKAVNLFDDPVNELTLQNDVLSHYDYCLMADKSKISDIISVGVMPLYYQQAVNSNIYHPLDIPYVYDVSFVGTAYNNRAFYVKYLLDNGIDSRVWGINWKKYNCEGKGSVSSFRDNNYITNWIKLFFNDAFRRIKSVFDSELIDKSGLILPDDAIGQILSQDEMIKIYSASKINLGIGRGVIGLRDLGVPMSGGFYLTEYKEELEDYFDINKEIVCYRTKEEMLDKVRFYLSHDLQREKIRIAGYERCRKDHSLQVRLEKIFAEIGFYDYEKA